MNTPGMPTYSIRKRLALRISVQATVVMVLMALLVYLFVQLVMDRRHAVELDKKADVTLGVFRDGLRQGGLAKAQADLRESALRRPQTNLVIHDERGTVVFRDPDEAPFVMAPKPRSTRIEVDASDQGLGRFQFDMQADTAKDRALLRALGLVLLVVPVLGGLLVGLSTTWRIRQDLQPLAELAAQTQGITAKRLDQRLQLPEVAVELLPWITQFNGLMDRLQAAINQLEAFNADVAHELRTPLASLMGHTEVALSRERSAGELREVMATSLEELQQIAAMVQDMLFLSRTDRGARARAADVPSLHALTAKVVEFHQYSLEEARLQAQVQGDARISADEPLLQRAISNLIENAAQHAEQGSAIEVLIGQETPERVTLLVQNRGAGIGPADLPRIFDRFFRADSSRSDSGQRHGLGLAIVAAIARMHGGEPLAQSQGGVTRVGFSIPMVQPHGPPQSGA
ncbi:MAG: heavy metal sensor histidine kinase [Hydrogenophaga sp.]|nr:heavy metal sensor histidine kinase [Hydrogenophaga sp.]